MQFVSALRNMQYANTYWLFAVNYTKNIYFKIANHHISKW